MVVATLMQWRQVALCVKLNSVTGQWAMVGGEDCVGACVCVCVCVRCEQCDGTVGYGGR